MTETRPFEPFTTSYSFTPLVVMEESLTKRASDDAFLKALLKAIVEDDSMTTADRDAAFLVVIDRYLERACKRVGEILCERLRGMPRA
jgi:hypothetical protein